MTRARPPRAVALGGGHGLHASLSALRRVTPDVTAVVTVGDDGGSSGRLRDELGALPPGDLRMALAALAGDDDWGAVWTGLLQHRFGGQGPLGGHAVGNLLLTGLAETTGDPIRALDLLAQLLGCVGRVLPMAVVPLVVVAEVEGLAADGSTVEVAGQHAVAVTSGVVRRVGLRPSQPQACDEAVRAVLDADLVVLGPGSWFTSVLPHLLVPDLAAALRDTPARRVLVLNLAAQPGETSGFSPERHLQVLQDHAPDLRLDVVVADGGAVPDRRALAEACRALGAELRLRPVAEPGGAPRHDPALLAAALREVPAPVGPPGAGRPAASGTMGVRTSAHEAAAARPLEVGEQRDPRTGGPGQAHEDVGRGVDPWR